MPVMPQERKAVLIIGARGEFGQFLQHDILPPLGVHIILSIGRDTARGDYAARLQQARHIVLATPLAGYAELACEIVEQCRSLTDRTTLWLIPSVQAGVWRAVTATLEIVRNPQLSVVCAHPMYGPNGFRATDPEARTFQNILTATHEGVAHPLPGEVAEFCDAFRTTFNIATTFAFDCEEHDRLTAYSQGLSYCVGQLMFEHAELDTLLREQIPNLHSSFHANHDLILDFIRINTHMPLVMQTFAASWRETTQSTYADVLQAFSRANMTLNPEDHLPISTKWYEKLRAASHQLLR